MIIDRFQSAFRSLRAARGFWLAAALSIAIGLGGNIAVFSLLNAVVIRPIGYPDADRLVAVTQYDPRQISAYRVAGLCPIQFLRWRKELQSFRSIGIAIKDNRNLSGSGEPETLGGLRVSAEFLQTLGTKPQLGRWFDRSEERRGSLDVVILTDSIWRRRFSADPTIVGRNIVLDGTPFEVIGVTDPNFWLFRGRQFTDFDFPDRIDVFLPLHLTVREEQGEPSFAYFAIGRLKPGVAAESARAELQQTIPTFAYEGNEIIPVQVRVENLQSAIANRSRKGLAVLVAAVGLVHLIVCVNIANLLLVRVAGRQRELAIRVALGATRRHLLADSLAESCLLCGSGMVAGLIVASWVTQAIVRWAPADVARLDQAKIDGQGLMFAAALTIATIFLFGLFPAWRLRSSRNESLRGKSRTTTEGARGNRIRSVLVGSEAALGTVLLIVAGLFVTDFQRILNAPCGFTAESILSIDIALPPLSYATLNTQVEFVDRVRDGLRAIPGVMNAAAVTTVPLTPEWNNAQVMKEGTEHVPLAEQPIASWPSVTADYFAAMNIPLRAGRLFQDEGETERVAVVSEAAARALWPGERPVGRRIRHWMSAKSAWLRVVGVVGDVRSNGLDQPAGPLIYRPFSQRGGNALSIVLRTALPPGALQHAVEQKIWSVDSRIPVPAIRTMREIVSQSVARQRMETTLMALFATIALLLAAIGVFGVVSYSVLRRSRELAVRLALGADRRHIQLLVLRTGMVPVLLGLCTGLVAALILRQSLQGVLPNIALHPFAFAASPVILAIAGLTPCYGAAQKAARTDPALALQAE